MQMTPVDSSMIHSIGYDAAGHILDVQFQSKDKLTSKWRYTSVTPDMFEDIMQSSSVGKAFNALVKGKCPGTQIG